MLIFFRPAFHQNGSMKMQLVVGNDLFCPQKNTLEPIHMPQKENGRFLEKQRIRLCPPRSKKLWILDM